MRFKTPTIPGFTEPHLYLGSEMSARTLTLSPTFKPAPVRTTSSSDARARQKLDNSGKSTMQSPSESTRCTLPTMPCLTEPHLYLGWEMSARTLTLSPTFKLVDDEGVELGGPSAASSSSTTQTQRGLFRNSTTASPSQSKSTTFPTSACLRSEGQPCLGSLMLALKRTKLPSWGLGGWDSDWDSGWGWGWGPGRFHVRSWVS
mmetsp:Transcript_68047/g.148335  ORF Transcript_68047/g.148335 Transcript_68047/m.148335 type:complete len:203 (+) Transcript_68047:2102-2710(+)